MDERIFLSRQIGAYGQGCDAAALAAATYDAWRIAE
jgi:hypothetical protein